VSANDLAVQVAGAAAGAIGWLAFGQPLTDRLRDGPARRPRRAELALALYLAALLLAALRPFDFAGPAVLGRKFREGRLVAVPFLDESAQLGLIDQARRLVRPAGEPPQAP
jgi:hypothetical protein